MALSVALGARGYHASHKEHSMDLNTFIRDIPDFPKEGIIFKDITPLLGDPEAFRQSIQCFQDHYANAGIDKIVAIESRGFLFGSALADRLGCGLVPVRKPGKLPADTISQSYDLEYGTDSLEIHKDALKAGEKVLVMDDLLATGGTLEASCKLVETVGGKVVSIATVIELAFLDGRKRIADYDYFTLLTY